MVQQIDDSVVPANTRLFIGAYWCFQAQNTPHKALALDDGLKLLNKAGETSYDAVELSLILDNQPLSAPEYSPGKKARTYRIGDHNQVYSEVKARFLPPANFSTLPGGSNSKASQ